MRISFRHFAEHAAKAVGTPWAFLIASGLVLGWAASGPIFGFSERWELVINSVTTIVTFLMVFIIQNTQNRDFRMLQVQIDELVRASKGTRRELIDVQDFSDEDLDRLEGALRRLRGRYSIDQIIRSLEKQNQHGS